ncbi:MAG: hypothetical protein V3V92_05495 [Candidatus Hydrothermarchaeales archaeon]
MSFTHEEKGQLGPFEELYALIVVVTLIFIFTATVSHSFWEYENRKNSVDRFSAGLDFSWQLRNNILALEVNGVPNPGLLSYSVLNQRANYAYLNHFWGKSYDWEVLIRDTDGHVRYEFGSLNKDSDDPRAPKARIEEISRASGVEVTVVHSPVALRSPSGATKFARMEVWVW